MSTSVAARTNRYAAACATCTGWVAAEAGVLVREGDAWKVTHAAGECPSQVPVVAAPEPVAPGVPEGYYAIEAEAGHLSFYRVKFGRKPGVVFVDLMLGGGDGGSLVRRPTPYKMARTILARIEAVGPVEAGLEFRRNVSRCCRCGRGLTNETSRDQSMGPECARKTR